MSLLQCCEEIQDAMEKNITRYIATVKVNVSDLNITANTLMTQHTNVIS